MKSIPEILKEVSVTNSPIEKIKILKANKDNDNLKFVLQYAYDRHITFGISKIDTNEINYVSKPNLDDYYFLLRKLLDKLKNRELTGNAAREAIIAQINIAPREYGEMLINILNKDLRFGAGAKIINKVYPSLVPEDYCQLANKFELKRVKFPCYVDTKLDGLRAVGLREGIFSRSGKELKNYKSIEEEIKIIFEEFYTIDSKVLGLDAEITLDHFQDLMRTVSRKEDGVEMAKDAVYNIFDLQVIGMQLKDRLEMLNDLSDFVRTRRLKHINVVKGKFAYTYDELLEFYNECIENKFEGIMVKDLSALYLFKRSNNWTKMKPEETEDIKIIGFEEGTGKNVGKLGAFVCETSEGVQTKIGIGFDDAEREEYWNKRDLLLNMIIEVLYQEKTREGCLRFGRFIRLRADKE